MEDVTSPCMTPIICADSFLSDATITLDVSALSDGTSASSNKSYPNILKRRDSTPQGPIKNLPFSPSRFLNRKKLSGDLPVSCKIMDSQEETLCISTTEDSGIEITSCEIDSLFTNPITSTPKLKKQELSTSVGNSFEEVLHVNDYSTYFGGDCVNENRKVALTSNKVLFRSPLIRRFINESGPRTPTPFKFRFGKNSFSKTVEEPKDRLSAEPCNKISYTRWTYRSPGATGCPTKRKARKALNMGYNSFDAADRCLDSTPKSLRVLNRKNFDRSGIHTKFSTGNESSMSYSVTSKLYESQYCEVSGTLSEHNSTKYQSFIHQSSGKVIGDVAYLSQMNEKLVRVACGLSDDQKAMTIAAKQYLRSIDSASANDSNAIIQPKRRLSHHLLC